MGIKTNYTDLCSELLTYYKEAKSRVAKSNAIKPGTGARVRQGFNVYAEVPPRCRCPMLAGGRYSRLPPVTN